MHCKKMASRRRNSFCRSGGKKTHGYSSHSAAVKKKLKKECESQSRTVRVVEDRKKTEQLSFTPASVCVCTSGHRSRSSFSGSLSCWQLKLSEVECNTHTHTLQPDGHHHMTDHHWVELCFTEMANKAAKHTRTCSSSLRTQRNWIIK